MRPAWSLRIVLLLLLAPLVGAHPLVGTPKYHCEQPGERAIHDYGPGVAGLPSPGGVLQLVGGLDGTRGDCDGDGTPGDVDGHSEYAVGGAWLLVESYGWWGQPGGSLECFAEEGHHPYFGRVEVYDTVSGNRMGFAVGADTEAPLSDPAFACGDFETDVLVDCTGSCVVPFGPGLDGSYQVFVGQVGRVAFAQGHVATPPVSGFPECADGVDNDGDGAVDWPADTGCTSMYGTDETGTGACNDGVDNDGDSLKDWPEDAQCLGPSGSSEREPGEPRLPSDLLAPKGQVVIRDVGEGPAIVAQPLGWICGELSVTRGYSTYRGGLVYHFDATVECAPPLLSQCASVGAYGHGVEGQGYGVVQITSSCGDLRAEATFSMPGSGAASPTTYGEGTFPWRCSVTAVYMLPSEYTAYCDANTLG